MSSSSSSTACSIGFYPLLHRLSGECVYSDTQAASVIFGFLSIGCWLFAQFPQVYANFRRGSADSLSLLFLFVWLFGDLSNLAGCILTDQMPFQTYLAGYFVFVDTLLFAQCLWYNVILKRYRRDEAVPLLIETTDALHKRSSSWMSYQSVGNTPKPTSTTSSSLSGSVASLPTHSILLLGVIALVHPAMSLSVPPATTTTTSTLLSASVSQSHVDGRYMFGQFCSYLCAMLYLVSRMPQILHNRRRKSVAGLAVGMFMFAVLGNLTYTLSIVLRSAGDADPVTVLAKSAPFLAGSGGTLVFDGIIFYQWAKWQHRR
ncbi:hypothetical protein RI367_000111 [Sorochytrium milnesiophthora]